MARKCAELSCQSTNVEYLAVEEYLTAILRCNDCGCVWKDVENPANRTREFLKRGKYYNDKISDKDSKKKICYDSTNTNIAIRLLSNNHKWANYIRSFYSKKLRCNFDDIVVVAYEYSNGNYSVFVDRYSNGRRVDSKKWESSLQHLALVCESEEKGGLPYMKAANEEKVKYWRDGELGT